MEVTVKMTAEEFQEFVAWRTEKDAYRKEVDRLIRAPCLIASSLRWAVEPVEGKAGRFKIIDQEHMSDAWDAAMEFMPKE